MHARTLRTFACGCGLGVGLLLAGCLMPGATVDQGQTAQQTRAFTDAARPLQPRSDTPANDPLLLSWTAVSGATHYQVYLGIDTNPPLLAVVDRTSLYVRDLPECATHHWRVVAMDDDGNLISSPTWQFETRCP